MELPTIEYSLCIFNVARTKMIERIPLPCPAPIYPDGHSLTINDDCYVVFSTNTSITKSDDGKFIAYVTEVLVHY